MENKEIRRANMLSLIGKDRPFRTIKAAAAAIDSDSNTLSEIKNRSRGRAMGDELARRFEATLGKPLGWMDALQDATALALQNFQEGPAIRGKVPLISWTTAGRWADIQDPFPPGEGEAWEHTTKTVSPSAFALRVVGDSMEPKIPDGSIVIIDPGAQYGHGKIVLAKRINDQQATLKMLWYDGATPKLKPLNDRYAILDMPDDTRIIGVAVELRSDL